jgi:hypothetical protein
MESSQAGKLEELNKVKKKKKKKNTENAPKEFSVSLICS